MSTRSRCGGPSCSQTPWWRRDDGARPMTHAWRTDTLESGGETIYFEVTGADEAPAVVLTHGAGGSHAAWFQQVPVLADAGYRAVTWDSRGFGRSTFSSGVLGTDAAVADLTAVLDRIGIEDAHLVG